MTKSGRISDYSRKRFKEAIVDENPEKFGYGKGMIVGMTRKICVWLYDEIIKLRPDWHSADDDLYCRVIQRNQIHETSDYRYYLR